MKLRSILRDRCPLLASFLCCVWLPAVEAVAVEPLNPFPVGPPFVQTATPSADGKGDDLARLRKALDVPGAGVLLLPAGTYTLNGCLAVNGLVRGAGVGTTIVRLAPSSRPPKSGVASAIRLLAGARLESLTVEVSAEAPDACGILIEDDAVLRNVEVRAANGNSATGIVIGSDDARAALTDVRVDGFAVGVRTLGAAALATADRLLLEGQTEAGLKLEGGCITARGLVHRGAGMAVVGDVAALALLDGVPTAAAKISGTRVRGGKPLDLVWKDAPVAPEYAFDQWVPVSEADASPFSVVAWGKPSPHPDYSAALQKACASGKPVVFLPPGRAYGFFGSAEVPASVRVLDGLRGALYEVYHGSGARYAGTLVVGDGPEALEIRNLSAAKANLTIRHIGPRPLVLRNVRSFTYVAEDGAGPIHMEHCTPSRVVLSRGQQAWFTDVAMDNGHGALIENRGASLYVRGLRTSRWTSAVVSLSGARTSIEGGVAIASTVRPKDPLFVCALGSALSANLVEWPVLGVPYSRLVTDPAGAVLLAREAPPRDDGPSAATVARGIVLGGLEVGPE